MYDYRNDLMTIIQNIGASPAELAQGRTILQAALNLINALPTDKTSRPTHRRNHQPPAHQFQIKRHETAPRRTPVAPPASQAPAKSAEVAKPKAALAPAVPNGQPTPASATTVKPAPALVISQPTAPLPPLNGDQYAALNKLKGLAQELTGFINQTNTAVPAFVNLTKRLAKLEADLSEADQTALASRLTPVKQLLAQAQAVMAPRLPKPAPKSTPQPKPKPTPAKAAKPVPSANPMAAALAKEDVKKVPAPFNSQKGQYVVQRELTGAQLLTDSGQTAGHISETIVRKFNLVSGTIVKADINPTDIFVHKTLRQIDHLGDLKFDDAQQIQTFDFGVVNKHKRHLRVTFNSNNEPLLVNGKKYAFLLDEDNLQATNGSIVELAWYTNDPDSMRIRWTYPTTAEKTAAKQPAKKSPKAPTKLSAPTEKRYPGIDLSGQTVAVLVGNRQEHEDYEATIRLYGGEPTVIDGFKTQKSYLKSKLRGADLVILVKSKAHHGTSKAVVDFQNQLGYNFAVANTLSMGQFEDALYRAANGFPADTASFANQDLTDQIGAALDKVKK